MRENYVEDDTLKNLNSSEHSVKSLQIRNNNNSKQNNKCFLVRVDPSY